jgi:hypothetical protein
MSLKEFSRIEFYYATLKKIVDLIAVNGTTYLTVQMSVDLCTQNQFVSLLASQESVPCNETTRFLGAPQIFR